MQGSGECVDNAFEVEQAIATSVSDMQRDAQNSTDFLAAPAHNQFDMKLYFYAMNLVAS